MKKVIRKIFAGFILLLFFTIFSPDVFGQIVVVQCNAGWNDKNKVTWLNKLTDVDKVYYIDIAKYPDKQKKYEVVVVPTIIILNDGKEVKRYQADISFSIKATKQQIQGVIDEAVMESY